jgi:NitT/TauT family transport system substrate-binding protein
VELQIFNNAQDRQSALQTESIDGAITDLVAVAANVAGGFDIKATTMTNGVFPLLLAKGATEKKAVKVGMMEVSVTNFLADEWLKGRYEIEKIYINDIPARLAAISGGQLDMGLFPEPLASTGELGGLEKVLFQPEGGYCPDVIVFTGKALRDKEKAIRLFHQACDRAVEAISQDPETARDILMAKIPGLKPEIRDRMILPVYTKASLQDDAYIDRIIAWTAAVMQIELQLTAADLVDRRFAAP